MHVSTARRRYKDKVHETTLLRRSLAGVTHVEAGSDWEIERSLPYGHVAGVWAMADHLGLPKVFRPPCPRRALALALVVARQPTP